MRDRNEPAPGIAAEVGDPAVVRATIRARKLGIEQLRLPQQAERGIEHGLRQAFTIEELQALLHVHGAERGASEIRLLRCGTDAAHLLGRDLPAHRALAELARLVDPLAHPTERAELARASDRGRPAVDEEVLEAVLADADAERSIAIRRLQVGLPQIGRLEDVAIAVDNERVGRHGFALPKNGSSGWSAGVHLSPMRDRSGASTSSPSGRTPRSIHATRSSKARSRISPSNPQ